MTILLDSPSGANPTVDGASIWRNQYNMPNAYVLSDQGPTGNATFSMVPGNSVGTPQISVMDPRTMQIAALQEGIMADGSMPPQVLNAIASIAGNNAATRPVQPTVPAQ